MGGNLFDSHMIYVERLNFHNGCIFPSENKLWTMYWVFHLKGPAHASCKTALPPGCAWLCRNTRGRFRPQRCWWWAFANTVERSTLLLSPQTQKSEAGSLCDNEHQRRCEASTEQYKRNPLSSSVIKRLLPWVWTMTESDYFTGTPAPQTSHQSWPACVNSVR